MSLRMLKSVLFENVILISDAYKMGLIAKSEGYSIYFNPFDSNPDYYKFSQAWVEGWNQSL